MTHRCVSNNLIIIGPDNGLVPTRRQAIMWANAGIILIRTLGVNFTEILSEINIFWYKKMHLRISSAKRWQFRLGLNVLNGSRGGDRSKQTDIAHNWDYNYRRFPTCLIIRSLFDWHVILHVKQVSLTLTCWITLRKASIEMCIFTRCGVMLSHFVVKGPPSKHMTCVSYTLNVYSKYNININKSSAKAFPLYGTYRPTVV